MPTEEDKVEKAHIVSFDEFIEFQRIHLKMVGILISRDYRSQLFLKVHPIYRFLLLNIIVCISLEVIFVVQSIKSDNPNVFNVFNMIWACVFVGLCMHKTTATINTATHLNDFLDELEKNFPKTFEEQADYEVKKHFSTAKWTLFVYISFLYSCLGNYMITGLIAAGPIDVNGIHWPFDFALQMWYPFDPYHHGSFELLMLWHLSLCVIPTIFLTSFDCLLYCLSQQVFMHFEQLTRSILAMNTMKGDRKTEDRLIRRFVNNHDKAIK